MCGIVSIIGQINHKEETIFKQLLEVDSLRGRHSTGVIKVDSNGAVSTKKKAVDGMDFVKLEGNWITQDTNKVLIGHNRWATKGAVNDVNAHPFSHGHIHGVHNGTLTQQWKLKDSREFEVDSDNIFYDISKGNIPDTVKRLVGAYAIALWDDKDKSVNLFRNNERPLAIASINDGKTVVIASESMMLEWVLERNNVDYDNLIDNMEVDKHVKFYPFRKSIVKGVNTPTPIVKTLNVKKLEPYKAPVTVYSGGSTTTKKSALTKYGLNGTTNYPLELVGVKVIEDTSHRIHKRYTLKMLCSPFIEIACNSYSKMYCDKIEAMFDAGEIVMSTLNNPYNTSITDGKELVCWAQDVVKANEKAFNLIEEELILEQEDDAPFQQGKK